MVKIDNLFFKYGSDVLDKLRNFEKYIRRQDLSRFLARYEIFKLIKNVKGSIIECGVHHGGGLMAWAKLSAGLEPYALHRKIIGFDTFEGFPEIDSNDKGEPENKNLVEGGFDVGYDVYNELQEIIKEYDKNRYLNQFEKVKLVKGNATKTIPDFIDRNPHLIVALLFLDFDLYQVTKVALDNFLPRMPKGSVIAFDEINNEFWPGETRAVIEEFKVLNGLEIRKFEFDPNISYAIL